MNIGDKVEVNANGIRVGVGRVQALHPNGVIVVYLGRDGKHKFQVDGAYAFALKELKKL